MKIRLCLALAMVAVARPALADIDYARLGQTLDSQVYTLTKIYKAHDNLIDGDTDVDVKACLDKVQNDLGWAINHLKSQRKSIGEIEDTTDSMKASMRASFFFEFIPKDQELYGKFEASANDNASTCSSRKVFGYAKQVTDGIHSTIELLGKISDRMTEEGIKPYGQ